MNFFESQEHARKITARLVVFFVMAVIALVVMTNLLVMAVIGRINSTEINSWGDFSQQFDWMMFALVGAAVCAVVLVGSIYKTIVLSAGGKTVAEGLDGRLVPKNTLDLNQRRLLNVVEEIAIASGTPVPPVYLLHDESGINAFAAGFSPGDAVIGITRGAMEQLNREQLQGIIAHEFSHILNGDMRLNIRLMGVLYGILVIGIIGYHIMRLAGSSGKSRSSNDKGGGGIAVVLGLGLMVIGFAGNFFGNLIKASVSRQREFLADASAVQFTRNPQGIVGALKRIARFVAGSKIKNPAASEVSHTFFAKGVTGLLNSLLATHPPLKNRIIRIDPNWDGLFDQNKKTIETQSAQKRSDTPAVKSTSKAPPVVMGAAGVETLAAVERIGNPDQATLNYARTLVSSLPESIKQAAYEPYGARSIIYTVLLNKEHDIRAEQLAHLQKHSDKAVYELTLKLTLDIETLDNRYRLPIIDMTLPALKQLSMGQYQLFKNSMSVLIHMDSKIGLFEWACQNILLRNLNAHFDQNPPSRVHDTRLKHVEKECELILSILAYEGDPKKEAVLQAFKAASDILGLTGMVLLPKTRFRFAVLSDKLEKLAGLSPLLKQKFVKACATCIAADEHISPTELELLRAFCDMLDCPMPPLQYSL